MRERVRNRREKDDNDDSDEGNKYKSETEENVNTEINKIPGASCDVGEGEEKESDDDGIESEKVHQEDVKNSIDTRKEIDMDNEIPEAVPHTCIAFNT